MLTCAWDARVLPWEDTVLVTVLRLVTVVPRPVSLPALFRLFFRWRERKLAMGISLESALPLAEKTKFFKLRAVCLPLYAERSRDF